MTRLSKIQHNEIIERYKQGELCSSLGFEFGISGSAVYQLLKRNNVQMQTRSYIYRKASGHTLNESAFDLDTKESAYWVGFLMADGAIWETTVALHLNSKDKDHLEKFKLFMGGTQSIVEIKEKNSVRYAFQSVAIVNKLALFGVTEKKSHTAKVPEKLKNNFDFWRGVIDGDGSIGIYKRSGEKSFGKPSVRLELLGSSFVINSFIEFVGSSFNIHSSSSIDKNTPRVQLYGKSAIKVINSLYENATIALDRKAAKALKVRQISL